MYALLRLARNRKNLTNGRVFILTFNHTNLKNLVVKLNKDQLRAGLTSDNAFMPIYSQVSVEKFGKSPGRWTLFDTGETYDTFKVVNVTEEAIIEFADLDIHGVDLQEKVQSFGEILGIDYKSSEILINEALPIMRDIILSTLLDGID